LALLEAGVARLAFSRDGDGWSGQAAWDGASRLPWRAEVQAEPEDALALRCGVGGGPVPAGALVEWNGGRGRGPHWRAATGARGSIGRNGEAAARVSTTARPGRITSVPELGLAGVAGAARWQLELRAGSGLGRSPPTRAAVVFPVGRGRVTWDLDVGPGRSRSSSWALELRGGPRRAGVRLELREGRGRSAGAWAVAPVAIGVLRVRVEWERAGSTSMRVAWARLGQGD
jgi:hypothetical protein